MPVESVDSDETSTSSTLNESATEALEDAGQEQPDVAEKNDQTPKTNTSPSEAKNPPEAKQNRRSSGVRNKVNFLWLTS